MLSPAQIQSARTTMGITPAAGPTVDRANALQSAWGNTPAGTPAPPPDQTNTTGADVAKQTLGGAQKIGSSITEGAQKFAAVPDLQTGSKTPVMSAIGTEAQKTGALLETGLGAASGAVQSIFASITGTIQKLSQVASDNPMVQHFANMISPFLDAVNNAESPFSQWATQHPDAAKNLADAFNVTLGAMGDTGGSSNFLNTNMAGGADVAKGLVNDVQTGVGKLTEKMPDAQGEPTNFTAMMNTGPLAKAKVALAKENVDPRLAASAKRLQDPVGAYTKYADQAQASLTDVKADPPIAQVGENIGKAYDQVVKMRRGVGADMASELAKVKDTPVNIGEAVTKTNDALFNTESGAMRANGPTKMTSFDTQQIGNYIKQLKTLGNTPTAEELDAFLSRVPDELNVAKAAKNITDVTNAERIIKGSLADLRTSLTSQPKLSAYAEARSQYADLSNFLDQGSKYLGAKTGGEYARDVSVAKSSAESILAGGKKDWLTQLESLTGYKALDDTTLAIQAMKDAGDSRGLSLFKSLSENTPTNGSGLLSRLVDWGAGLAKKALIGSPADQTKLFLKSLQEGKPPPTTPKAPPKTGVPNTTANEGGSALSKNPEAGFINVGAMLGKKAPINVEANAAKANQEAVGPLENTRLMDEQAPGTLSHLNKSFETSGHDYESMITKGIIPKESVYQANGDLQPAIAGHVVSDMAGKMDAYQAGLGAQFVKSLGSRTRATTVEELLSRAKAFVSKNAKVGTTENAKP